MAVHRKQTPIHYRARRTAKKHVKLAVVPHRENQYKPHLIRRHGLMVIALMVIVTQFIGQSWMFRNVLGDENQVTITELLADTNAARAKESKQPLQLNSQLSHAAYLKAQDMLKHQYWAHTSPQGIGPWKWIGDVEYNYAYAGENLARNFKNSSMVVGAWMKSPTHRDNLLKSQYRDVGFATVDGVIQGKPVSLVVAMYAAPASDIFAAVQGANFTAPVGSQLSVASKAGLSLQAMNPIALSSIVLLLLAAIVALVAQLYVHRIPKYLQSAWNKHHGLAKAASLSAIAIVVITFYGTSGQL